MRSQLSQLMKDRGLGADALYYEKIRGQNRAGHSTGTLSELETVMSPLPAVSKEVPFRDGWGLSTSSDPLSYRRLGVKYTAYEEAILSSNLEQQASLPWYNLYYPEVNQKQRLSIIESGTGKQIWTVPLRGDSNGDHNVGSALLNVNHLLVVFHEEMISVLSPVDQRILWTERLVINNSNDLYQHYQEPTGPSALQRGRAALNEQRLLNRNDSTGMIAFANSETIGVYGRRRLDVLDTMTGERLWSMTDLPRETTVTGNRDVLLLRRNNPESNQPRVQLLSTRDGRELSADSSLAEKAFYFNDQYFVTIEFETPAEETNGTVKRHGMNIVRAINPRTEETYWSMEFDVETRLGFLPSGLLIAIDKEGHIHEVDLNQATRFSYSGLTEEEQKSYRQFYAFVDEGQFYLVANRANRYAE
ncbi:MAG: hypothetical protein R3C11_18205, partial [Planctomycetaceae bacterium]